MIFLGIEDGSAEISRVLVSPYLSSFARGMSYATLGIVVGSLDRGKIHVSLLWK